MSIDSKPKVAKPVPLDDNDQRPYWHAASQGRLVLQRCAGCGRHVHPPAPGCPYCGGADLVWDDLGSEISGHVYSYVVVHRPFLRSFIDDVPYVVALVELDGVDDIVRVTGNILGLENPSDVEIGMPVRMLWEDRGEGVTVPQWEPLSS